MALIKQTLETQILNLITDLSKRTENQTQSNQDFARELASIIDAYIKTATVSGTITGVDGTGSPVTGTCTGTLS